jgi:aldose 1-epimerase
MSLDRTSFGQLSNGESVSLYRLCYGDICLAVSEYGATLVSLEISSPIGRRDDIVLGFSTLSQYCCKHPFFGSTVGRFANRISDAAFSIDGTRYVLWPNNGPNSLHGGFRGFDKYVWKSTSIVTTGLPSVCFELLSPDGDEGYPGNLHAIVTYSIIGPKEFSIDYEATCDAPCPVSLTNHSYFNLKGQGRGTILDHEVELSSDTYLPVDEKLIPTGEVCPVNETPFDFRKMKPIGRDIELIGGYDHCFSIPGIGLRHFATVFEPTTKREMRVASTMPGVQFYSGNFLSDWRGKFGTVYDKHSGFCLETQYFPDSPNRPEFPSSLLIPGKTYRHRTEFSFN